MARAIDADDLIRHAKETKITAIFPNYTELSSETRNAIGMYSQYWKTLLEDAPTIEAGPVKHGEWIDGFFKNTVECSLCVESGVTKCYETMTNYCPYCGARMAGE